MANDNLKNLLALSKKADEIAKTNTPSNNASRTNSESINSTYITSSNYDEKIAELNEQVFGKYQKPKDEYSAEEEIERIKKRSNENIDVSGRVLNPILQEVFNNPYNVNPETVLNDNNIHRKQLEEKLSKKFGNGLEEAKEICKTLEENDKQKTFLKKPQTEVNETSINNIIDYSLIKTIIEKVIDDRLNNLTDKIALNENVQKSQNKTGIIMLGENFTFVDNEGNMYKCGDMKYIGKMKLKSK